MNDMKSWLWYSKWRVRRRMNDWWWVWRTMNDRWCVFFFSNHCHVQRRPQTTRKRHVTTNATTTNEKESERHDGWAMSTGIMGLNSTPLQNTSFDVFWAVFTFFLDTTTTWQVDDGWRTNSTEYSSHSYVYYYFFYCISPSVFPILTVAKSLILLCLLLSFSIVFHSR